MKRIACWTVAGMLAGTASWAKETVAEDRSVDPALVTWSDPSRWEAGIAYAYVSRPVVLSGIERDLRGDVVDAAIGISPAPWLLLYGQAGGSRMRLEGPMREEASWGAGGLLGARVNLWQLHEGESVTSWRVTLQLAGQYAYRTAEDDGDGDVQWEDAMVMLPLNYHLWFRRNFRSAFMSDVQGIDIYAGPAFSKLDGTWTRRGVEQDFEEAESFGAVAGAELWLLENLAFGARADWFEGTTGQVTVRYRF